jgi:FkbM family methyltransferase
MFWRTPGTWLYKLPTIWWLSDPSLVRQLPRTYQLFARYCDSPGYKPAVAELLLRGIIAFERSRKSSQDGIVPLHVGDATVFLDLQDPRFLHIPQELSDVQRVLQHFLRPGDTFIDIGANHGTFSIVASRLVGPEGLVVSIEPQPRKANLLRKLMPNGPSKFELHQIACGDHSGEVAFFIPSATSGSAGVFPKYSARSHHSTIRVPLRRLDDLIDSRRLPGKTVIKLDVEGSELAVLLGARQLIQAAAPPLLLEINPQAMQAAGTSKTALTKTLLDLGYECVVTPGDLASQRPLNNEALEWDLIALPAKFPAQVPLLVPEA